MVKRALAPLSCVLLLLSSTIALQAQVPDLTDSADPNYPSATVLDKEDINLGPTGMKGWVYHESVDSSLSRQILVTSVDAGSPADGILAVDDVILGADGSGANPGNFNSDARRSLAYAIQDAEASSPATLKLLRWRAGETDPPRLVAPQFDIYINPLVVDKFRLRVPPTLRNRALEIRHE